MNDGEGVLYREVQRPRMWWAWLAIVLLPLLAWWAFIQQVVLGEPWGDNPASDAGVWALFLGFGIAWPVAFAFWLRLITEVTADEVRVRLRPFNFGWVRFPIAEIEQFEARRYRPVREYLGWGIRWGPSGRAYNLNGNEGVQLVLSSGRRVLIGSERAEELETAIRAVLPGDR